MAPATRTLNPLHFEDLEPHRFEDLVRQLIYEWRDWHSLEATGRLGSDEGVDIRGHERVPEGLDTASEDGDADDAEQLTPAMHTREWRMQCKRERQIGPAKIAEIVDELLQGGQPPHGVVVAAACDFSKKSRDTFRVALAQAGVEEFVLWGKAELEDLLFRPQNDHLLWAYFGISIRIRRRSLKSQAGARLATKRRLVKVLGDVGRHPKTRIVLVRDPEAEEYPWSTDLKEFLAEPRWRYYQFEGHVAPDLLGFVTKSQFAWLDRDTNRFDVIVGVDSSWPRYPELAGIERHELAAVENARWYWEMHVPQQNQATLIELSVIHYDQILAVDDIGDSYHEGPHLLVDYEGRASPFRRSRVYLDQRPYDSGNQIPVEDVVRYAFFPRELPEISWEQWRAYLDDKGTGQ